LYRWPEWAVNPFLGCLVLNAVVFAVQRRIVAGAGGEAASRAAGRASMSNSAQQGQDRSAEFRIFQWQWLSVYLVIMLADWLQGTHMYTLYTTYGQTPGTLFAIGFTSSAVFGTFLGLYVDKYGRRLGCIAFCLLEVVINVLEHYNDFYSLAVGRIMGGISTSLLFTAFESWMVSEHRKRGFPEEDIAKTFAVAQIGNGICAVLAGVLAQLAADQLGDIGPFQLAIALTLLALVMIWAFWSENYGGGDDAGAGGEHLFQDAMLVIAGKPKVFLLGLIQSFFEGAMYTFVILWVPTLASMVPGGKVGEMDFAVFGPGQGWVFASMMLCISLGGQVFEGMMKVTTVERGTTAVCCVAAASMVVPIFSTNFHLVLLSFLAVETCIGASFGALATLRSHLLPDQLQASIMNVFRVPLNILVVAGTTAGDYLKVTLNNIYPPGNPEPYIPSR